MSLASTALSGFQSLPLPRNAKRANAPWGAWGSPPPPTLHPLSRMIAGRPPTCGPGQKDTQEMLPSAVVRVRAIRRVATAGFSAMFATAAVGAGQLGMLPDGAAGAAGAVVTAVVAGYGALAAAKAVGGDAVPYEIVGLRVFLQGGAPREGPPLIEGSVEVRPSPGKGNGAFAAKKIPEGTWVGDYEGDILSEGEFWARYPGGVSDYVMGISGTEVRCSPMHVPLASATAFW
mmetsp:Transcript_27467/g.88035  ORF Transcript_27467/g.88035 Transcript_27467/m.88035 type:complete len:232 (-) Transcript_27467:492-1187(-)